MRTPSDFGTMGDPPTHPELLDWLADRFVAEGWSLKKLHRLILASNTYRMSRRGDPEYAAEDPEVRLLWRSPYRRLDVEAIRDSMLAVSGNLNPAMFGPSVYPVHPQGGARGAQRPGQGLEAVRRAGRLAAHDLRLREALAGRADARGARLLRHDAVDAAAERHERRPAGADAVQRRLRQPTGPAPRGPARQGGRRRPVEAGRAGLPAGLLPPADAGRARRDDPLPGSGGARAGRRLGRHERADRPGAGRRLALEQFCRVVFNSNEFVYTD